MGDPNAGARSHMHQVIFYPVGNGDTSQIILGNGRRVIMDFHHLAKTENGDGPEIDLAKRLREELSGARRNDVDVVAFTHGDEDHIKGASDFFELLHADKYQGSSRVKMRELWVPAAMIVDEATNTQLQTDRILLRQEARYRLRRGSGIRIFSKPELLRDWMAREGIDFESRKHLFTDAGQLVPGFNLGADGVEFFVHSPFIRHTDDGDDLRNSAALIFNVRFDVQGTRTDFLAVGDTKYDVMEEIVATSEAHGNLNRLDWDLFNIPHHCSAYALSFEKGEWETLPAAGVQKLLRRGKPGAYLVSSSDPIPDTTASYAAEQPPHIQARKAYQRYLQEVQGRSLIVTMEHPNAFNPEPLVFEISSGGVGWKRAAVPAITILSTSSPPRAG